MEKLRPSKVTITREYDVGRYGMVSICADDIVNLATSTYQDADVSSIEYKTSYKGSRHTVEVSFMLKDCD